MHYLKQKRNKVNAHLIGAIYESYKSKALTPFIWNGVFFTPFYSYQIVYPTKKNKNDVPFFCNPHFVDCNCIIIPDLWIVKYFLYIFLIFFKKFFIIQLGG